MIKKVGNQWCVFTADGKEKIACHDSEEDAKSQLAAIEANKKDYANLDGVEIFASGSHNGDAYSESDLDEMISAFNELDFKPALKLGHDDAPGAPAVGYVGKLWRNGTKLLANFTDINDKVFAAIKSKAFNRVSAEIYWNLQRGGKKYRRALKALALLGAHVPAVEGLKPLEELFSGNRGEVHIAVESELTTDSASAVSAARRDVASTGTYNIGDINMTKEELDSLTARLTKAEEAIKEEKVAREAAEKKLADSAATAFHKHQTTDELLASISKLTGDEKDAKVAELSARVASAEKQAADERKAREAAETKVASDSERLRKLEETSRHDRIEKLAETCRLPALRPFVRQYADLATRSEDVKVYDAKGNQKSALTELEAFISYVNGNAARLFHIVTTEDPARKSEANPGQEVDRRAKKYMDDHPSCKDYREAVRHVLDADPTLKADYAAA